MAVPAPSFFVGIRCPLDMRSIDATMYLMPQANLKPAEAAELWSTVKDEASALGADIVSPAVNFCGGDCNQEVGQRDSAYDGLPACLSTVLYLIPAWFKIVPRALGYYFGMTETSPTAVASCDLPDRCAQNAVQS